MRYIALFVNVVVTIILVLQCNGLNMANNCVSPAKSAYYANNPINVCICPITTGTEPCALTTAESDLSSNGVTNSNKLQVALIWDTGFIFSDMDLSLKLPDGTTISKNSMVSNNGILEIDNQGTSVLAENIFWPDNSRPSTGLYSVFVSFFSLDVPDASLSDATVSIIPFTILVRINGKVTHISGKIQYDPINTVEKKIYQFEYPIMVPSIINHRKPKL